MSTIDRLSGNQKREVAIQELMKSQATRSWVENEAKAFSIDLNTPEGKKYYKRELRKAAERVLK